MHPQKGEYSCHTRYSGLSHLMRGHDPVLQELYHAAPASQGKNLYVPKRKHHRDKAKGSAQNYLRLQYNASTTQGNIPRLSSLGYSNCLFLWPFRTHVRLLRNGLVESMILPC